MAKKDLSRSSQCAASQSRGKAKSKDEEIIRDGFTDYLKGLGYADFTVEQYKRRLIRFAGWLCEHPKRPCLSELTREKVLGLLADFLPDCHPETLFGYRKVLFHWLKSQGRYSESSGSAQWQHWLDDYLDFLKNHRGVGAATIKHGMINVKTFLRFQFGVGPAEWTRLQAADIWRFAAQSMMGVKPVYAKARLGHLRRFLLFVYMRGSCSDQLAAAVPKVAVFGDSIRPEVLSVEQQRKLLASFDLTSPEGKRDYAMTLCMLHLGLRGSEVIGLRLGDIDWQCRCLTVAKTKTGRSRELPAPRRLLAALRDYIKDARPKGSSFDHVFLRHSRRNGQPITRSILKNMLQRAYRRCGFPRSWSGTHRLRHTFASHLYRQGADVKPIADLLGHRRLDSTIHYTRVDVEALRTLAQPWPR